MEIPLNKPYKHKLFSWGGLQLGASLRAEFPREGRMLRLSQWGLGSHPQSRTHCSRAARGCGASRGLSPPLQSMPGARSSNGSAMILILAEAQGKYYFAQCKQVDSGVMPRGRCVLRRGKLRISPLGMASWEAY